MVSLHALLDLVASLSLQVVETLGYPGVFILMVMESMIFPVPSEAVLPPAGWLAYEGRMNLWIAFVAATLGTVVGSLLSYWMGLYGVRPFLEKYGRYVLVTPHHLDMTHKFFDRRGAAFAVFLSRFVPVVRHLISIPAGSARMPLVPFLVATVLGGGLWNLILLYAGFKLGENWALVTTTIEEYKFLVLGGAVALVVGVVAYYWVRRKKAQKSGPA